MRLPQSNPRHRFAPPIQLRRAGLAVLFFAITPLLANAQSSQLTLAPSSLTFGVVDTGQSETLLTTITNSGAASVTIAQISSLNAAFTTSELQLPMVLAAGQSVDLSVIFSPTVQGWTGGTIKVSSNASNSSLQMWVQGTGVGSQALTITPSIVSFGQVALGGSSTVPVVLANARAWSITLTGIRTVGTAFSMSGGPTFPLTLAAGQSVNLDATFKPQSAGEVGGSIFVMGPGIDVPLTGTGTSGASQLTIAPAPLNFGNVQVGSTEIEAITLSASGGAVTVSSASSNSSEFILQGVSFPFTIPAGQGVSVNVGFTPSGAGAQSGTLIFGSNASNSQASESLDGTGTNTQYTVNLTWNSTPNVMGYNVYRSTAPNGAYSKINPGLDANTAYADNSVASGSTYYYAATSVNSNGQESKRSTPPVQAVIP
jgi:hypothetical protein